MPCILQLLYGESGNPVLLFQPHLDVASVLLGQAAALIATDKAGKLLIVAVTAAAKRPVPGLDEINPSVQGIVESDNGLVERDIQAKPEFLKFADTQFFTQPAAARLIHFIWF